MGILNGFDASAGVMNQYGGAKETGKDRKTGRDI